MGTLWSPDTCGCQFETEADATRPEGVRMVQVARACQDHPGLAGQALYDAVLGENQRKNQSADELEQAVAPDSLVNFSWSFDAQRNLRVSFETVSLSPAQKAQLELLLGAPLAHAVLEQPRRGRIEAAFGVTISAPTAGHRNRVQARLDARFGPNKAQVV